jgi:hypothetical protein
MIVTKRPYKDNFSDNPIVYELYHAPAANSNLISFEVIVFFINNLGQTKKLATIPLTPYEGYASINIAPLLIGNLTQYLPASIPGSVVQADSGCTGTFFIHYRSVTITGIAPPFDISEEQNPLRVWKGGVSNLKFFGDAAKRFFNSDALQQFATWIPSGRLVPYVDKIWLTWYNTRFLFLQGMALTAVVYILYNDGTDDTTSYPVQIIDNGLPFLPGFSAIYLPVGGEQLNLNAINPGKIIFSWSIKLTNNNTDLTDWYKFENDLRNDYNNELLYFRNSAGGIDAVRLRGVIEQEAAYDAREITTGVPAGWQQSFQLPFMDVTQNLGERITYKCDIGYFSLAEQDAFRDILLLRECYLLKANRYYTLNILTKVIRLRSTADYVFSFPIEFSVSTLAETNYTPDDLPLPSIAGSNVCLSTIALGEITETIIDADNRRIVVDYGFTDTPPYLEYRIDGGGWAQINAYDEYDEIAFNVSHPGAYAIEARIICDDNSRGPIARKTFATIGAIPPGVNNSALINETLTSFDYILKVNGTVVSVGDLGAGQSAGFYWPDTPNAIIDLQLVGAALDYIRAKSNGVTYIALNDVTIVNGVEIKVVDDPLIN